MSTYFVVGDIHGKAQMLEELMTEWDGKAQLVFLGDLIDRGENSKRSIEIVKDYVDHHGAVCLSGNHEYMFLAWLDNPEERYDHYRRNGGDTTINSLLGLSLIHIFSIIRDTNSIEVFVDGKTLSMTFYETTENPVYTLTADEGVNWVVKTYQK